VSLLVVEKKHVALCRDGVAIELALFTSLRIEIILFDFENRSGYRFALVRIEAAKGPGDFGDLLP
jgi:hypothetical protein